MSAFYPQIAKGPSLDTSHQTLGRAVSTIVMVCAGLRGKVMAETEFLRPRFVGPRFEEHSIPFSLNATLYRGI